MRNGGQLLVESLIALGASKAFGVPGESFKAGQSALSEKEAPLAALHTALKGMVSQAGHGEAVDDAGLKNTATGADSCRTPPTR